MTWHDMYLMWIEIWIEYDDGVRTPEIDPDATSSCGQEIDEHVRTWSVELVHALLTIGLLRVPILK